jgi:hypothetical protein
MLLPYGLLKAHEALSCELGLARHNVHKAKSSFEMGIEAAYKRRVLFSDIFDL